MTTALAELTWCNPFEPRRIELERLALGERFVDHDAVWHERGEASSSPNLDALEHAAEELVATLGGRLGERGRCPAEEARLYRDLVLYLAFNRHEPEFKALAVAAEEEGKARSTFRGWSDFRRRLTDDLSPLTGRHAALAREVDAAHLVACFFQVRRAFHLIFRFILGGSATTARLRAEVWHSIFGHDMRRYHRALHAAIGDITTLITGPSGTGKEVVARAVALSRYLPFNAASATFEGVAERLFVPLNLSALSPTLIESELFGHKRGAFTGAVGDRTGWLEACPLHGTVFLDEIGEVSPEIQVKLLRVIESRSFERLGDNQPRRFAGKLVAATNRDLDREMQQGGFRQDLYYRLCGDLIRTPSLRERLDSDPGELHHLVVFLAHRAVAAEEAPALAREVERWVERELGSGYPWPGNVRELDQCVRNVLLRREYRPPAAEAGSADPAKRLAADVAAGRLDLEELTARYAALVYGKEGSWVAAGRRLGVDRRTVKRWVEEG
ncbi:MAG TPA: sigma 54-interacting transcriptional regulator [Thermoanaerobaculia bacterium]|nr:sigma 54-interacting transcriptional regulator [Thermoanaerobaculia bacterium]